jgi:hypothetical protein
MWSMHKHVVLMCTVRPLWDTVEEFLDKVPRGVGFRHQRDLTESRGAVMAFRRECGRIVGKRLTVQTSYAGHFKQRNSLASPSRTAGHLVIQIIFPQRECRCPVRDGRDSGGFEFTSEERVATVIVAFELLFSPSSSCVTDHLFNIN